MKKRESAIGVAGFAVGMLLGAAAGPARLAPLQEPPPKVQHAVNDLSSIVVIDVEGVKKAQIEKKLDGKTLETTFVTVERAVEALAACDKYEARRGIKAERRPEWEALKAALDAAKGSP